MAKGRRSTQVGRYVLRALVRQRGRWQGRIRDTETGRVWQRTATQDGKARAREELVDYLRDLDRAGAPPPEATCAELWPDYLAHLSVRERTRDGYRWEWARSIGTIWADRRIAKIKPIEVQRWATAMRDAGLAPATVGRRLGLFGAFVRWAMAMGYLERDPTIGIRRAGSRRDAGRPLTVEQCQALLAYLAADRKNAKRIYGIRVYRTEDRRALLVAVALALYTGLRRGNVLRLRWPDVDLAARRITLPAERMKGGRDHAVPIHADLAALLAEEIRHARSVDGYVLGRGRAVPYQAFPKGFKRALVACGLPDVRWHDLRHTFASILSTRVPWAVLQALLGHAPSSVTAVYTHPSWADLEAGIAQIPRLFTAFPAAQEKFGKSC